MRRGPSSHPSVKRKGLDVTLKKEGGRLLRAIYEGVGRKVKNVRAICSVAAKKKATHPKQTEKRTHEKIVFVAKTGKKTMGKGGGEEGNSLKALKKENLLRQQPF